MERVVRGGVICGAPGLLIVLVPLLLHELDVISSDQSQIGFIGVPLLFIGVFIGTLVAASGTPHVGSVRLGVTAGFVVGLAGGVFLAFAFPSIPGIWLLLAPAAMIAGGALGARWGESRHSKPA